MDMSSVTEQGLNAIANGKSSQGAAQANSLSSLIHKKADGSLDLEKARATAEDFESFFLSQMLQPMFASVKTNDLFGGGHAEDMWRSMMVDEYGKMVAKSGGVGIADAMMSQLIASQEA